MWFTAIIVIILILICLFYDKTPYNKQKSTSSSTQTENITIHSLFECVDKNDFDRFKYLLSNYKVLGLSLYLKTNTYDVDILFYAVNNNRSEMVKLLLDVDEINVNRLSFHMFKARDGIFPLAEALASGNEEMIDILLSSKKLKFDTYNNFGCGIFSYAYTAISKNFNIDALSNCLVKIINTPQFNIHLDLDLGFELLLGECIKNNLTNVIEVLEKNSNKLKNPILINLINAPFSYFSKDSSQDIKISTINLISKICENDISLFNKVLANVEMYDLSNTSITKEYTMFRKMSGYEKYVHLLVANKLGYSGEKTESNRIYLQLSNSNDLLYNYCQILFNTQENNKSYYQTCKSKLLSSFSEYNLEKIGAPIIVYLDKVISLYK